MSRAERREKARLAKEAEALLLGQDLPGISALQPASDAIDKALEFQELGFNSLDAIDEVVITVSNPGSGLRLFQALEQSSYLRMAALPFNGVYVMSNGRRMWTADPATFNPVLVPLDKGFEELSSEDNWGPVVGDGVGGLKRL